MQCLPCLPGFALWNQPARCIATLQSDITAILTSVINLSLEAENMAMVPTCRSLLQSSHVELHVYGEQIPLRLERRQWCCHVSCISIMQVQVGTLLTWITYSVDIAPNPLLEEGFEKLVKFLLCSSTLLCGILCFLWSSKLGWYWSQTDWIWITSTQ